MLKRAAIQLLVYLLFPTNAQDKIKYGTDQHVFALQVSPESMELVPLAILLPQILPPLLLLPLPRLLLLLLPLPALALSHVELILTTMVLEFASAMLDSINQEMIVYKAPLVESIVSGELMDRVNACLDLPTTTEFALSALQELSGAQLLTDVSLFADKTQPILRLQMPVSALVDLV